MDPTKVDAKKVLGKFHEIEINAVYTELTAHRVNLLATERYTIAGALVVAGWGVSAGQPSHDLAILTSLAPMLVLALGALRALSHLRHYRRISAYLEKVESEFAKDGLGYHLNYRHGLNANGEVLGSEFAAPTALKWLLLLSFGVAYFLLF